MKEYKEYKTHEEWLMDLIKSISVMSDDDKRLILAKCIELSYE